MLVWTGPLLDRSGFGDDSRALIAALDRSGVTIVTNPFERSWGARLSSGIGERIETLLGIDAPERFVHVLNHTPTGYRRHPRALRSIGRSMFESDRLPDGWADRCNEMDEIWVPSRFNVETFARAGVDRERLHRVPSGLQIELYDPEIEPLPLELEGFVFLSVFAWGRRKGWDLLLRAFVEEFRPDEEVALALKIVSSFGRSVHDHREELERFIRHDLGRDPARAPRVVIVDLDPGDEGMSRLYRAADAYVMPSHGEGWGRPYMEAMAMGLPTIGTRWSGNLDYMTDDNSYLIECRTVEVDEAAWREWPIFRGHRWAEPSLEHLRHLMRRVVSYPAEARAKGSRARADILARYTAERAAAIVLERLRAGGVEPARVARGRSAPVAVRWEGPQFVHVAVAQVNRELCRALLGTTRVALEVVAEDPVRAPLGLEPELASLAARRGPGARPAAVHVRHTWPPDFGGTDAGRLVLVLPWEMGSLPRSWVQALREGVDEVWVPSNYVRDCFARSGVDPAKVQRVPNGINPLRFNGRARPLALGTERRFRFLFVGGTIARKGADVLVDTYIQTFRPDDDVALVVKDFGTDTFYLGQGLRERIRRLQQDSGVPEIVYLDGDIAPALMPSLYAACHSLVHPYRGEAFALPVAEAMASGLPVIVTAHGACLDYCDPSVAYLVPAQEVALPAKRVGELETVDFPWWAEPDRVALAERMRAVVAHPAEARALGARARAKALEELTWRRSAQIALERIEDLAGRAAPRRTRARPKELGACIVVRDEAPGLANALESVRGVASEIVVVETGSGDRSREIALSHGAVLCEFPWRDDFAAARNESLRHATKDWILVLDADQTLDPASHDEIRRLMETLGLVGYLVRQLDHTGDGVIEHLTPRLFPNRPELRYVGRLHEQLVCGPADLPLHLALSGVILHRHSDFPRVHDLRASTDRDLELLLAAVREEPDEPLHLYDLGVAYHVLGRDGDAEQAFLRAIALGLPRRERAQSTHYLAHTYLLLALTLARVSRSVEAAAYARHALALSPEYADAHAALAACLARAGDLDGALAHYERALACGDRPAYVPTDRSASGWRSLLGMSDVHLLRGDHAAARACVERARAAAPERPEVAAVMTKLAELKTAR